MKNNASIGLQESASMTQLQTLKGFRDFLPAEKRRRDFVMEKMIATFRRFGFAPLETPTLEYRETIMGKYGDEADKLVYQFRDNGDREVAMRYDQTVPTARVIAQYRNELVFPFRRYQTQNVFRADKPQRGRYREFTQCDIDIFGTDSAIADAEILACTYAAFKDLGMDKIELRINDRRLLTELLTPFVTTEVSLNSILQSVDKLDKIAEVGVIVELARKGLAQEKAEGVMQALANAQPNPELQAILEAAKELGVPSDVLRFNPTIARGLDYYTGMIFEIVVPEYSAGSLGGGGRYDRLIGELSGTDTLAVGMAFGFDRTVEAVEMLGLLPDDLSTAKVLVTLFSGELREQTLRVAQTLRDRGVATEMYVEADKLGKQMKYADRQGIPFAVVMGPEEAEAGEVTVRDLRTGDQRRVSVSELQPDLFR